MARIRTIKPEFFTSEDIVSMTPLARLFYVSLWCESDREGRMEWKPGTFKMRYLPGDACDVSELAKELIGKGLIVLYTVDGKQYAEIPTFTEHQVINNRESESVIPARVDTPPPDAVDRTPSGANLTPATRETVIARDGGACLRCGGSEDLTVDHIFPQSIGGTHALKNLRCLCRKCNSARPVSGSALIADLAVDKLTLADMDSYCFDASPRVKVASARVKAEGNGKEGKEGKSYDRGFEDFWKAWPQNDRKQDKKACAEKWAANRLGEVLPLILADVETKKKTKKWIEGFVEAPEVYINNRRWEDGNTETGLEWHETASGVEARAVALGVSPKRVDEQWPMFKQRVMAAHKQGAH